MGKIAVQAAENVGRAVIPRRSFRRGISLVFKLQKRKRDSSAKGAPRNDSVAKAGKCSAIGKFS
jgi:hypothetical protein